MDRKEYLRKYAKEHKEERRRATQEWRKKNREKYLAGNRECVKRGQQRTRAEILRLLGNKCSNPECPIPREKIDLQGLQIDHINGGGTKMRRALGPTNSYNHILKEIKAGSHEYQLLCAYCNFLKRLSTIKERGNTKWPNSQ